MKTSSSPLDIFTNKCHCFCRSVYALGNQYLADIYSCPTFCSTTSKKAKQIWIFALEYRPISKWPFIAKALEKVVAWQLTAALKEHNTFNKFQSGLCKKHSRETALLRFSNDLFMQWVFCAGMLFISSYQDGDSYTCVSFLSSWLLQLPEPLTGGWKCCCQASHG